jgi:hypothetical protein
MSSTMLWSGGNFVAHTSLKHIGPRSQARRFAARTAGADVVYALRRVEKYSTQQAEPRGALPAGAPFRTLAPLILLRNG